MISKPVRASLLAVLATTSAAYAQEAPQPISLESSGGETTEPVSAALPASENAAATSSEAAETESLDTIPVAADESAPPPEEPTVRNRVVEEIVVTAQKREERLQDVPISIQAFSGDALAARGLQETDQLGQAVPGLQFSAVAGFQLIFLRGIGTDNFVPSADPSVATYVDGIYIPPGAGATTSIGNVQRVEVLKGPQGTLFGRNATGGAISITTEEPGNEFKGSVEAEGGNFASASGKANISGPVTDWLSVGVSAIASRKDSYYSNINFETQDDGLKSGRVKVNVHPTDELTLSLTAFQSEQQGLGSVIGKNIDPSPLVSAIIPAQSDDFHSISDYFARSRAEQKIYYGNLTWNLPWADLKVFGSDASVVTKISSVDFDGSPLPIAGFDTTNNFTDLQTAELQLVSNDGTWNAERFKWVTGLYYLRSDAGFDPAHLFAAPRLLNGLSNAANNLAGITIPQNLLDLLNGAPLIGDDGVRVTFSGILGTKSYSAYAQGTYYFTDWLDLTLGGRFQREERYLTKANTRLTDNETPVLLPFALEGKTDNSFSPRAVLSLHPAENTLLYASYSVGYKSGTYNIVNIYTPPNYIKPEEVKSYELGAKLEFLDGLLRLNGAVFYNDIKDLQSGFVSLFSGGAVRFLTVPGARTRGAEVDATWVPLPDLNPGLALTGNVAYVDAKYTEFKNGEGFNETTGLYERNQNYEGNHLVRTPKVSGGIGVVQTIDLDDGEIELALDEYYNSGFYYDSANNVEENNFSTLGARAGYLYRPWQLRLTLFGMNLLNENTHIQKFPTDFGVISTRGAPREFGLRLNWAF